jgi:ubiquinone/menaquinone biosynthesis C-methylase UbiE
MATLARRFCEFENRWLFLHPRQVIVELVKGQRVLDVCCGSGDLSAQLAAAGCHVVGVDSSERMVSYAREKRTAAQFEVMDASAMPFEHEFDAAVISLALHALSPAVRERVWEATVRAVTAGGLLIALDCTSPQHRTLLGRTAYALIDRDERSFLKSDPEHYHHFHTFMQHGGLRGWALAQRQVVIQQQDYWGGTVELAVLQTACPQSV